MRVSAKEGDMEITLNGVAVRLPAPLRQYELYGDKLIVLLDPDWGHANVFAYDQSGSLIWTIEKYPFADWLPYGYLLLDVRDEKLYAADSGSYFELDSRTGRILSTISEK